MAQDFDHGGNTLLAIASRFGSAENIHHEIWNFAADASISCLLCQAPGSCVPDRYRGGGISKVILFERLEPELRTVTLGEQARIQIKIDPL